MSIWDDDFYDPYGFVIAAIMAVLVCLFIVFFL